MRTTKSDRRGFLAAVGTAVAIEALPGGITRAPAAPAAKDLPMNPIGAASIEVRSTCAENGGLWVHVTNLGRRAVLVNIADNTTGESIRRRVGRHQSLPEFLSPRASPGRYDVVVTVVDEPGVRLQLARTQVIDHFGRDQDPLSRLQKKG
jgi:hypothetical protein